MGVPVSVTVLSLYIMGTLCLTAYSFPLHASCKVEWTFGITCDKVNTNIVNQIQKWTSADNCQKGGEKCLYKLVGRSDTQINATHETPVKHYVDNLTFDLMQKDKICSVKGASSSATWYAVLDKGTNYCNLRNLITGSGLDKTPGFTESTSSSVCTQYTSANCDKY